jgi:hypothetical protein
MRGYCQYNSVTEGKWAIHKENRANTIGDASVVLIIEHDVIPNFYAIIIQYTIIIAVTFC